MGNIIYTASPGKYTLRRQDGVYVRSYSVLQAAEIEADRLADEYGTIFHVEVD